MRPYSIVGMILIVFGILAVSVRSITYFTTDQVIGPLGFFVWDVSQPHTIFINPVAGILAVVVGLALIILPGRQALR